MVGLGLLLAFLAAVGGVVGYLMTGDAPFLVGVALALVVGASGYVIALGRRGPR